MNTLTDIKEMHDNNNGTKERAPYSANCKKKEFHKIDVLMGARVRFLRIQNGMSQEALGKACGVTFQQCQKYELGANRMGSSRLFQVAQALDITVSRLFDGIEEEANMEIPDEGKKATRLELECSRMLAKLVRGHQEAVHRILKVLVGTEK